MQYFRSYDRCLGSYFKSLGGLDLSTDTEPPAGGISSMVSVIVRSGDGAYITTSHGDVFLKPNTLHWIPKEDADQLIRDGVASKYSDGDIFGASA